MLFKCKVPTYVYLVSYRWNFCLFDKPLFEKDYFTVHSKNFVETYFRTFAKSESFQPSFNDENSFAWLNLLCDSWTLKWPFLLLERIIQHQKMIFINQKVWSIMGSLSIWFKHFHSTEAADYLQVLLVVKRVQKVNSKTTLRESSTATIVLINESFTTLHLNRKKAGIG